MTRLLKVRVAVRIYTGTLNYLGSQGNFPEEVTFELLRNEEKLSGGGNVQAKTPVVEV